jgi:hypothetical protein
MTHLEINHNNNRCHIARTNEDGFVTHEVEIAETTDAATAVEVANRLGWSIDEPWWTSGDFHCIALHPTPVWVSFIGDAMPENAIELANGAGVMALSLLKTEAKPDEGKVRGEFAVSIPRGWTWTESPSWQPFTEDIEI